MKKLAIILAALILSSSMLIACSKKDNTKEDETTTKGTPSQVEESTNIDEADETTDGTSEDTTDNSVVPENWTFTDVEETKIYTVGSVNLRKEPSFAEGVGKQSVADHTELTKIAESNEKGVDADGVEYKFYKVKYGDKEWFVKSILTTSLADPDEGFTAVSKTLYFKAQGLTVRQFPNTENPPAAYLSHGEKINVIAEKEGWYKISYEGKYVKGEFYVSSDPQYWSETPIEENNSNSQG